MSSGSAINKWSERPTWFGKIDVDEYEKLASLGYTPKQLAMYYGVSLDELAEVDTTKQPVYDLWAVLKNKEVAFNGKKYRLKVSQRQQLRKQLAMLFAKYEAVEEPTKK